MGKPQSNFQNRTIFGVPLIAGNICLLYTSSKNQIIWGGNYFVENLTNSSCWVVWDKDNGDSIHADCELAWTSCLLYTSRCV